MIAAAQRRSVGLAVACLLLLGFALTACSSTSSPSPVASVPSAGAGHNNQDVTFARQLIELSQQLNTVVDIMIGRTDDTTAESRLNDLSRTVRERVALCRSWLISWNAIGASASPAPGLVTDEQVEQLITADATQLAVALNQFIADQQRGIEEVSAAEVNGGDNPAPRELARDLPSRSQAELSSLKAASGIS